MYRRTSGMTLVELLIACVLLSLVVLGLSSLHSFSHYQVISSDRRTKLQNDVSYVLAHMTKEISRAIGNERVDGVNTVINTGTIDGGNAIRIYIDSNATGDSGDGRRDTGNDHWIAYRLTGLTGNELRYCPQCTDGTCTICTPAWGTAGNTLSTKIANFIVYKPQDTSNFLTNNYVEITLTGRWQPSQVASMDNPEITMRNRIKLPSVSTN